MTTCLLSCHTTHYTVVGRKGHFQERNEERVEKALDIL
jgi:hypothetical protein